MTSQFTVLSAMTLGAVPVFGQGLVNDFTPSAASPAPVPEPIAATLSVSLDPIGTYESNLFDDGAAEIVAHDPGTQRLFVVNASANTVDVLDIVDPTAPLLLFSIDLAPYGGGTNSVAVGQVEEDDDDDELTVVGVAVENDDKQAPGQAVFFDVDGNFLSAVTCGALPDMVTFTPNGNYALVANEGEPDDTYTVDPEGSISVIDLRGGVSGLTQADVRTADFNAFDAGPIDPKIRIFGPGATVSQDLEPEYITVSKNSRWAWVSLQENNALAKVDIKKAKVTKLLPLGLKDHLIPGNELDASNEDNTINIQTWPVFGMYQPDAIASFKRFGTTFIITANEGDARDYDDFSEEARVKDLALDPLVFTDPSIQNDDQLGRLKTTTVNGDADGDGLYEKIYAYGARSFSIWTGNGKLVYDSGSDFEQITAAALLTDFNSTNDENNTFDDRSDDKGPEPEGVAVGKAFGRQLAFIGLERVGGIMVYDVSKPWKPVFLTYVNNRDFTGDPELGTAGDLAPEGLVFIKAGDSPNGKPLLVVGNEVSGTTTIYQLSKN